MDISTMIEQVGRTPTSTARLTGLSRMTIQRVREGTSVPTIATLRELALAAGYDIAVTLVAPGDPAAAVAARVMYDSMLATSVAESDDVAQWVARLKRHQLTAPDEVLALAGKYAAPQHHPQARFFAPRSGFSHDRLTSAVNSAGVTSQGAFALSGIAAADYYLFTSGSVGPVVLWSEHAEAACDALSATFREAPDYQPGGILVAPAPPEYFVDSLTDEKEHLTVVSPIQAALDLHGLGYTNLALNVTEGW
ncbi:transcriptional regulator with XRE-family HTH domain [Leucobacter exalbidus]|uniref:Transcriptional regulator with XRE-family HTH domain n=1 Tax=Leucobacter exalbidus TaxID=662960 RepID=A0A940PKY1_9MICO|nr:helix-turn-helix transcriptional regulator [Leucobacter exalbidus]MBP1325045.1 transcriptional regulator with XRE-family HTH domain [Leucobacter exalbidus]